MLILLRTQVESADKTPVTARRARVGSLCGFRSPAERVPIQQQKTRRCADVRERCGKRQAQNEQQREKLLCGKCKQDARKGKAERFWTLRRIAGQSRGVVRAPRRSHLPAVRAVSGIHEGVPKAAKNSRRALQNEKSPPFQGKQRSSNEIYEVNTEKW